MIESTSDITPGAIAPQYRVLNAADAALIWVMKWAGDPNHVIAHKLNTMPSRVADVLAETTHVGSKDQAKTMMAKDAGQP